MSNFRTKFTLPNRYGSTKKNIWAEYEELVSKHTPIDLGYGFPDFLPPEYVRDAFIEVANVSENRLHQYTRPVGHPRLVSALSKLYSNLTGRDIDPFTEIVVGLGGYHAMFVSINGFVDQGDEVIIIEPFYVCFKDMVETAGGKPRLTSLKLRKTTETSISDDWIMDDDHLESLFNERTKAIIINTPHNPFGKVFTYEELTVIAKLCQKWNVLCISNEVYEFLTFDSKKHVRIATLPGMWDRTITVSSAGKIFGVTGFRLGWVYGPAYLIANLHKVQLNSVRAGNTFLQEVVAICLEKEVTRFGSEESYLVSLAKEAEEKRNFMFQVLSEAGFKPILPSAGYFIVADWTQLGKSIDLSEEEEDATKDFKFTNWMIRNVGVLVVPLTPFFAEEHNYLGEKFLRFCFVKSDDCLKKVAQLLKDWKLRMNKTL